MGRRSLKVKSAAQNVKISHRWTINITIWAFMITVAINALTSNTDRLGTAAAVVTLLLIILLGILFDLIGVAVSTASETPFHSMSAKKIAGAPESIWIIRHAHQIANFCGDVIGDVAGVISGAMSSVIVLDLSPKLNINPIILGLVVTGLAASLMIGGKSAGKGFAMIHNNTIVFLMGKTLHLAKGILPKRKKKRNNKKQV